MRPYFSTFCLLFCVTTSYSALSQTTAATIASPTPFQQEAQVAVTGGKSFSVVNLSATAEWTAGSLHESGTAQLQANLDGSTNVQLALGPASRTEVQTAVASSRTCTWTDAAGTSHPIGGANCFIAVPWFAPSLSTQPISRLPALLGATDNGEVSTDGSTVHQLNYLLNLQGTDVASTNLRISLSTVKVYYDPQTFLPASLEYSVHPDGNDLQSIPVKVTFGNYQSVSGVMLPYHIERFVNQTLQLKLDVTTASIE